MDCRSYLKTVNKDSFHDYFREEKFTDVILVVEDDRESSFLENSAQTTSTSSAATFGPYTAIRLERNHSDVNRFLSPRIEQTVNSSFDGSPRQSTVVNETLHTSTVTASSIEIISDCQPTGTSTPLPQSRMRHPETERKTPVWSKLCHKIVLAKNSLYFERLFEQAAPLELAQHQHEQRPIHQSEQATVSLSLSRNGRSVMKVELKNIRASSLEILLNFIYKGEFNFDHIKFGTVLEDAQTLKFNGIVQFCEDFLNQPLHCSNCVEILLCSKSSHNQKVYEKCLQFLSQNFLRACDETSAELISNIPYEVLQALMDSTNLAVESEDNLFRTLISWVEHDVDTRSLYLLRLMQPRINLLSADFLLNFLAKSKVVRDMKDCLLLIMDTAAKKLPSTTSSNDPPSLERKESAGSAGSSASLFSFGSSGSPSSNSNSDSSGSHSVEEETVCVFGSDGIHEILDPVKKEWKNWEESYLGRSYEIVMVQDSLLVISGCKDNEVSSRVDIYNFHTKRWFKGPSLNKERDNFATCATESKLVYVFGGTVSFTDKEGTNSCEMLDYTKNCTEHHREFYWTEIPPMKLKRWRCKAASFGDRIFVIGGQTGFRDSAKVFVETESFHNNQWSFCAPMKESRTNFGIATLNDKIYVCGGWRNMNNISSCERYDIEQNVWEPISKLRIPRQSCCACAFGNNIVVIGCFDSNGWTNSTEVYNPTKNKWSRGPPLVNNQKRPKCAKVSRKCLEV